ncbi:MAG TPA: hypothetical protein VGQ47_01520, partial [Candidatus Limnocylindrales bacterium]|nr:hypothetical protein [Candidatus Limnocylindrales bacterium]
MATVSYIPNDPLASNGPATRQVSPGRFPAGAAGFDVQPPARPGSYPPQTPAFDYWQAQTALIAGLRAWREIDGRYLPRWYGEQQRLPAYTNAGDDLNAFYDRSSLQFFSHTYDGLTVHSAESVDVVTHEEGHALLDAIRPDFFDVPFIEAGALHEAFGDCVALLTGLRDRSIRDGVLALSPDLSSNQFLESLAEQLGDAIRREFGSETVESGALRHALNVFRWSDPTTLPPIAPAEQLCGEVHSFSRVFTGAFYDVLRNIFASGRRSGPNLRRAARTAGRLLVSAIRTVPATPRLFEGVGRGMLQADVSMNRGQNVAAITSAFQAHGILLGAPAAPLPVPLEATRGRSATRALKDQLDVPSGTRLETTPVETDLHGRIAHVTAYRPLRLTGDGLEGVRIMVPAAARVTRRGRAIGGVLGDVAPVTPEAENDARAFARALAANGQLRIAPRAARRVHAAAPQARGAPARPTATHEIRIVDGEATIR